MAADFDDLVSKIGDVLLSLHDEAFDAYRPIAYDLCSRTASEHEVALVLDYMMGFCGDERLLELFEMICGKYCQIYPEMIAFEIDQCREWFEDE